MKRCEQPEPGIVAHAEVVGELRPDGTEWERCTGCGWEQEKDYSVVRRQRAAANGEKRPPQKG